MHSVARNDRRDFTAIIFRRDAQKFLNMDDRPASHWPQLDVGRYLFKSFSLSFEDATEGKHTDLRNKGNCK